MYIAKIGIIGAGAWGTALAQAIASKRHNTIVWAFEEEVANNINLQNSNPDYLPGIKLSAGIKATTDIKEAANSDVVLMVTPAQFMRSVAEAIAPALRPLTPIVICSKGIEQETGQLMTEIASNTLINHPIAILSGPTFAEEVARGLPTAVTLATSDKVVGKTLVDAIGTQTFRPYLNHDVIGAEIGGAIKNVLAIACGIAEGKRFGNNGRAALVTRGLAEMTRLCVAKGGQAQTIMGLSGIGDLALTCTSTQSRNYSLGIELGEGRKLSDIMAGRKSVAEGVFSAAAVSALASKLKIDMPISAGINAIVNHGESVEKIIRDLLSRPFRIESEHLQ
ncbi:MAG: glycerol-3-phosphate acyltransferase [Rhodospirillaceae bacterium]|nr:glycerol-3-phosphate acyltransferase [Rhodospirillaceae bacterium]|tara:strand:+ start:891 stop:1898 length:1008 start_codon:yes stop_codon:yes gene_type:complete